MANFLGIDIGTSSVKAALLDEAQLLLGEASAPLSLSRPQPGWSEQDPADWWQATEAAVGRLDRAALAEVAAIGLSGQQHGATLLDGAGAVLRPAILWNDGRAQAECRELLDLVPDFTRRAANLPMPGFTAPKLLWVRRHEPGIFARTQKVLLPKDYVALVHDGEFLSDCSDAAARCGWMSRRARGTRSCWTHRPDGGPHAGTGRRFRSGRPFAAGDRRPLGLGAGRSRWPGWRRQRRIGSRHRRVRAGDGFLSLGTSGVGFAGDRSAGGAAGAHAARLLPCSTRTLARHGGVAECRRCAGLDLRRRRPGAGHCRAGAEAAAFAGDPVERAQAPVFLPIPHRRAHAAQRSARHRGLRRPSHRPWQCGAGLCGDGGRGFRTGPTGWMCWRRPVPPPHPACWSVAAREVNFGSRPSPMPPA